MQKILILLAHPFLERSRIHNELVKQASRISGVTINDLYEWYPEFDINVRREQQLLLDHDIIIWQHPFYWYSAPALLKQWQDIVLEHDWAYGRNGTALKGKKIFNVLTTGAGEEAYKPSGFNKYTIQDFLRPYERTAELCHMTYWPSYWVSGVHKMTKEEASAFAQNYAAMLEMLVQGGNEETIMQQQSLLNTIVNW